MDRGQRRPVRTYKAPTPLGPWICVTRERQHRRRAGRSYRSANLPAACTASEMVPGASAWARGNGATGADDARDVVAAMTETTGACRASLAAAPASAVDNAPVGQDAQCADPPGAEVAGRFQMGCSMALMTSGSPASSTASRTSQQAPVVASVPPAVKTISRAKRREGGHLGGVRAHGFAGRRGRRGMELEGLRRRRRGKRPWPRAREGRGGGGGGGQVDGFVAFMWMVPSLGAP